MKLTITINADNSKILLKELKDMWNIINCEINDPICKDCSKCKDGRKGCFVEGRSSDLGLESEWKLRRKYDEHKHICKSKTKK
jgi:hypothetical protein